MREHWGLGIGHYLAHGSPKLHSSPKSQLFDARTTPTGTATSDVATVYSSSAMPRSDNLHIQYRTQQDTTSPELENCNKQGSVDVTNNDDHNDNPEYATYDLEAEADEWIDEDEKDDEIEGFYEDDTESEDDS
jgi:hypothetical protein